MPAHRRPARLVLADGSEYRGTVFGAPVSSTGEVVFATGMVGYPESLTDPSYREQILVLTYPLVGNYGVPPRTAKGPLPEGFESERIHVDGLVIQTLSSDTSHWSADRSLAQWLDGEGVPGIEIADTRALAKRLRESGTMLGKLLPDGEDLDWRDPNHSNLVAGVSIPEPVEYGNDGPRVVLVDTGAKTNIVRGLVIVFALPIQ